MHLAQVQYLFTGGNKGLPSCSKAIKEMYELYQSDYDAYLSTKGGDSIEPST